MKKTKAYAVDNHPQDARFKLIDNGVLQAMTARSGTGGG